MFIILFWLAVAKRQAAQHNDILHTHLYILQFIIIYNNNIISNAFKVYRTTI